MHTKKIEIESTEYHCWHEVGHATACIHFGGVVEFATELILSEMKLLSPIDNREFIQILFKNASRDREIFFNKNFNYVFSETEDMEFMNYAKRTAYEIMPYTVSVKVVVT